MNQRPSKTTRQSNADAYRARQERWAAYTAERRPAAVPVKRRLSANSTIWFIGGLLFLQIVLIGLILTPVESPPDRRPPTATATTVLAPTSTPPPSALPTPKSPASNLPTPPPPSFVPTPTPTSQPALPPVLRLRGMEITQGIQVFNEPELPNCQVDPGQANHIFCNNSIPLVAGRHTLVRVYPACAGDCPAADVTVRLRLLKNGQEQASLTRTLSAATLQRVTPLAMPELRLSLDNSVNFEFFSPPAWLTDEVTFALEAGLPHQANQTPAMLTLTKEFAIRKPLRVAYLPITYQGLRPPEPTGIDHWLLRMYPLPAVEYYRLPVPDLVWDGDLNKGEILRRLLYTYWLYTQNQPPETWPDQLFGWLPQEAYNGGASDPFWCPNCTGQHSSRVAFGGLRPEEDIGGPRILAHEIAHNLGAQHAWSPTQREDAQCFKAEGADIWVDPGWPYPQTPHIQEFGLDLYSQPPVIYPPSAYDMMAYCAYPWISPYSYRKIFDSAFLRPDTASTLPLANYQPQVQAGPSGTLLVSGIVYPNGTVSQPEIIQLEASAFGLPATPSPLEGEGTPSGQDYCLDVQAADGTILAQRCFKVGFLDLETGQPSADPNPFLLTLTGVDPNKVAKITLNKNNVPLAAVLPSNHAPQVTITFPTGGESLNGEVTVTWQASDADGDPLRYDLLYSPDAGQTWLPLATRLTQTHYAFSTNQIPMGPNGLFRVLANDGFHTGVGQSEASFAVEPPVENSLSLVGPGQVKPGQSFEVSVKANRLTEPGLFGLQFKLNFDPTQAQVNQVRLHPDLNLVIDQSIDPQAGQVSLVASRQGQTDNLTGDITVATFNLTAASTPGVIDLHLSDVTAGSRGGLRLDFSQVEGLSVRVAQ